MLETRQLKKLIWLASLLAVLALLAWIALRPRVDGGHRAENLISPPTTQSARLPQDSLARQALLKRGVADALRLAAAGDARESLQIIDRLIAALEIELSALAKAARERSIAEQNTLDSDRRALQLVKTDIRLKVNEISEPQWLTIYETAANADAQSFGRVLEQLLMLSGQHWSVERLWTLLNARFPAPARALLATHLAAYHTPDDKADLQQSSRFYEALIARCIDTPVVAQGLLERYVQELDRRSASAAANTFLWNLLKLLPDSRIGAKAAILLIAAEPAGGRPKLIRDLWATYPATEVAKAIRSPYLELLSRDRQLVRLFQLLDVQHALSLATTRDSLAIALADLARRSGRTPALAFSRRRIAPTEPNPGLPAIHPIELCAGLAEEVTGKPLDASALEVDAPAATQPSNADPLKASLINLLNRALETTSFDRVQEILLADIGKPSEPPSTQPIIKPVSQPGYELAWQAGFLKAAGKVPDAIRLCRQTIEAPPDRDALLLARRTLVELLLDHQPLDVPELDRQFAALKTEENGLTSPSWNLAIRALLRRVLASPPGDRQAIWTRTLQDLREHPWPLADQTLADLDRFASNLGAGTLSPLAAMTDLLLLASDIETMSRLQARRLSTFLTAKAWDNVDSAIQLHWILASFTQGGPFDQLTRDLELARTAGLPADRMQQLATRAHTIFLSDLSQTPDPRRPTTPPPIDAPLRQASQSLLQNSSNLSAGFGARRRPGYSASCEPPCNALAHAFAGDPAAALRTLHASLDRAPTTNDALGRFDDIALVLAVADGSPHHANRFAQWLADRDASPTSATAASQPTADSLLALLQQCELKARTLGALENEARNDASLGVVPTTAPFRQLSIAPPAIRNELANAALRRWGQRAVAWGAHAMTQGATPVTQTAWTIALNIQRQPASVAALTELMINNLRGAPFDTDPSDRLKILESMLPHLRTAQNRQHLHARIIALHRQEGTRFAKALFDEGSYADCLASLDQLDKAWPQPPGAADIPTAFVRALCLIRLERLTDAANLLSQMESWPAFPEQHARALFLTGWIHLQTDDRPRAIAAFQRLFATYPQTSFAPKAKDLLANLE